MCTQTAAMDLDMRPQIDSAEEDPLGNELRAQDDIFPSEIETLGLLPEDTAQPLAGTSPHALIIPEEPDVLPAPPVDFEQRKRRRQEWQNDQHAKQCWELQRRLVDISTDVERVSREVRKICFLFLENSFFYIFLFSIFFSPPFFSKFLIIKQVAQVRSQLHVPLPPLSSLPDFERQTLESAHNRRVSDILVNHCRKTLTAVMTHKWSWPFNAPVDLRIYKDYLEKVETPMDFGSIKKKLDGKEYTHPDQFLKDMRTVFANAQAYNKPGSDVHVMAVTLQEKFEEKYAAAAGVRVAEENSVAEAEIIAARRRYAGAAAVAGRGPARDAAEARAAVLIKYIDQVNACVADAKSAAAAMCVPVTRQEKERLAVALGRLPQSRFETAIGIVLHHHPGLQPFDDVRFDLDMLDALTLRQLMSFVTAADDGSGNGGGGGDDDDNNGGMDGSVHVQWPGVAVGSGLRPFIGKKRSRRGTSVNILSPTAVNAGVAAGAVQEKKETLSPSSSICCAARAEYPCYDDGCTNCSIDGSAISACCC